MARGIDDGEIRDAKMREIAEGIVQQQEQRQRELAADGEADEAPEGEGEQRKHLKGKGSKGSNGVVLQGGVIKKGGSYCMPKEMANSVEVGWCEGGRGKGWDRIFDLGGNGRKGAQVWAGG
eukprot:360778-Chlamydomonas_euryale.AAC.2